MPQRQQREPVLLGLPRRTPGEQQMNTSRRYFLKVAGLSSFALAAGVTKAGAGEYEAYPEG